MEKINWGILGLGQIAQKFSEGFSETSNAKLLAIASKNIDKLKNFKDQFKVEEKYSFNRYEDLINCDEVDIIYIALPNSLHHYWSIQCIKNDKNILVEKPATLNFEEIKDIEKNLQNKKVFFGEAFMYRYLPQIELVLDIIKKNEIGNPVFMKSSFGINLLTKKKFFFITKKKKINPKNRLFNKFLGGGCILDLGCYPMSFSLLIGSLLTKLKNTDLKISNIQKEIGETDIDIDAYAEIFFEGGFHSQIRSSFKKNLGNKSEIICEKGKIIIDDTWLGCSNIIKINDNKHKLIETKNNKNIYSHQIQNISKNILNGFFQPQYPGMSFEETLLNMKKINEWLNA